ncbi:envelope integrity protein Cei [Gordonia sp. CPCC 206044]|uniref:envelope integrity protein Cei n=1 Tax=Gordonia sp. CPCC 206044 TaxID=3140793 RepID=UPI003AF35DF6
MVSQITAGSPVDSKGRPFRRRRQRPAVIAVVVLFLLALITWAVALVDGGSDPVPTACNQPSPPSASPTAAEAAGPGPTTATGTGTPKLTVADTDEMRDVTPAALSTFQVRVLNASSERGAAQSVSDDLASQGFNPVPDTPFADDTVYANHDLACVAQIRFGPAGKAGAAALWLAIPCAELVDDGRQGTAVDVALGEYYEGREQTQDQQAALGALRSADPKNPQTGADPSLVNAIHSASC